MVIDIHAHHVSRDLIAEARRNGTAYGLRVLTQAGGGERLQFEDGPRTRPFFPQLCDLDVRFRDMDTAGVDVQVISTWMDLVGYWLPPEQGRRWARLQNETLAEAAGAHPDRLWAMGTLPLQDVPAALQELDYCAGALRMKALEIGCSVNGHNLDDEQFRPVLAAAQEAGLLLFLHPPMVPMALERLDRFYLHNICGNPMETTVAASRLIFGGILDTYPEMKCCLSHAGGFLPYQIGRLERGHRMLAECQGMAHAPSAYLGRFYYDTIAFHERALAFLLAMVGSDRVLFGSDYPFPMGDPDGLARVRAAPLDSAALGRILSKNALEALQV